MARTPITDLAGIAARTQIVSLSKGAFRPTKRHKAETDAENKRHGTTAARVSVRISDHPGIRELQTIHNNAYRTHIALTRPCVQDGFRLLPAGKQLQHAAEMATFKKAHDAVVKTILADYANEKATAPDRLKTLYDPKMWPEEIKDLFRFEVRYLPCPTDGAWGEWLRESARAAEDELRERVTKTLQRVVNRCKSEGALFESVFTNLAELVEVLPDLNITADPALTQVAAEAKTLAATDKDDLVGDENRSVRNQTAAEAARILSLLD